MFPKDKEFSSSSDLLLKKATKTFDARTRERWRGWLARHHASESEVWLIFHKRHTGKPSVAYDDAVDEAMVLRWIDSLIKRIDDDRYARKFTPRKAESNWSSANVKRYAALKRARSSGRAGLVTEPRRTANRRYAAPRRGAGLYRERHQEERARLEVLRGPRTVGTGACT